MMGEGHTGVKGDGVSSSWYRLSVGGRVGLGSFFINYTGLLFSLGDSTTGQFFDGGGGFYIG